MILLSNFCDKCGNDLKDSSFKFCDKCGAEVTTNKNKVKLETNISGAISPYCGGTTPIGQTNCVNCGVQIEEKNTIAIIIGYLAALIFSWIGLIPGIYLLTRNSKKSRNHGIVITLISLFIFLLNLFVWSLF